VEAFTQKTPEWNRAGNSSPHLPESIPQPYRKVAEICLRIDPGERATINDVKRNLGIPVVLPKPRVAAMPEAHPRPERHPQPERHSQPEPHQQLDRHREAEPHQHTEVPQLRSIERNFSQKPRSGMVVVALLVLFAVTAVLWMYSHGSMPAMPSFSTHSNQPPEGTTAPGTSAPQTSADKQSPSDEQGPSDQNEKPAQRGKSAAQNQQHQPPQVAARPDSQAQPQQAPIPPRRANGGYGYEVGFVTKRVMPNVAPSASRTIRGTINVVVRVNVDPGGNVSYAGFQYPGSSRYFSRIAMDAARQWKFKPAIANGRPVASAWTLHFAFDRDRTLVTPAPSAP